MRLLDEIANRLIAFDTTSDRPNAETLAYLAGVAESLGFQARLQQWDAPGGKKANLVATLGPAAPDGLILSGHVDTVPFEDQPGWEWNPLALGLDEHRAYGRGTSDMKVFLAQCLAAIEGLPADKLTRPLVLLFTSDEEVGCLGAKRLVEELEVLLESMPCPCLAWIGEPTSWQVFFRSEGTGVVRYRGKRVRWAQ